MQRPLLVLGVTLPNMVFAQEVDPALLELGRQTVVHVLAVEDAANPRSAAGFVWPDAMHVVTALHVVAGDDSITVKYAAGERFGARSATIERVLAAADLALLRIEGEPLPNRTATIAELSASGYVWVFGFPYGTSEVWPRPLYSTHPPVQLHDVMEDDGEGRIRRLGFPNLDLDVLRVANPFGPGDSGAPIFDKLGNLIAIGSGGLRGGTAGLGWATLSEWLDDLAASDESTVLEAQQLEQIKELFMYREVVEEAPSAPSTTTFRTSFEALGAVDGAIAGFYPVEPIFEVCQPLSNEYTTWSRSPQAKSGRYSINLIPNGNPRTAQTDTNYCSSPTLSISGAILETVFDTKEADGLDVSYFRYTTSNPRPAEVHNCDSSLNIYVMRNGGPWDHYSAMCGQYVGESDGWTETRFSIPAQGAATMQLGFLYTVQNVNAPDPTAFYLIDDMDIRVSQ